VKKLLVPTLLGVLSLAYYGSSWPRAANGAQDDTAKTAREMTHIVMEEHDGRDKAFIVNTLPTGGEGIPPWANVLNEKKNFLPCRGGPYALCYYSGPDGTLPCTVKSLKSQGRNVADCSCIEVPYGPYFVDINAIMDLQTYELTVAVCGKEGEKCPRPNQAPVCEVINNRKLIPGADMISVFSFACVPGEGIASIPCDVGVYAGCMTAPCYRNPDDPRGIVRCECPLYEGCYEVGTPEADGGMCELRGNNVWSSAHNQTGPGINCPQDSSGADSTLVTFPPPDQDATCIPDAPQGVTNTDGDLIACPLFPEGGLPPEPISEAELVALRQSDLCTEVCTDYRQCGGENIIGQPQTFFQHAYTCDAVLCTSKCAIAGAFQDDLALTNLACRELSSCGATAIAAIIELELMAGCSCCASQVCGCGEEAPQINDATQIALFDLNTAQCERGITPQCCLNGTLCGKNEAGVSFSCVGCPSESGFSNEVSATIPGESKKPSGGGGGGGRGRNK